MRNEEQQQLLHGVQDVKDVLVLICGHGGRDIRCGITGPILRNEFERLLSVRGLQVDKGPVGIPGVEEGSLLRSGDDQLTNNGRTARVALISHIGGHKFAGNVILYMPPEMKTGTGKEHALAGCGIWYGRVEPRHVEGIIQETIPRRQSDRRSFQGRYKAGRRYSQAITAILTCLGFNEIFALGDRASRMAFFYSRPSRVCDGEIGGCWIWPFWFLTSGRVLDHKNVSFRKTSTGSGTHGAGLDTVNPVIR